MKCRANSRAWGRPRVRERGDARAHDDRDEEARPKSGVVMRCPPRRRLQRSWTVLAFRPGETPNQGGE